MIPITTGPMGTLMPLGFPETDLSQIDEYREGFYGALCRLSVPMGGFIDLWDTIERRGETFLKEMLSASDLERYNISDRFRQDVGFSLVDMVNGLGHRVEEIRDGCFTLYLYLPDYLSVANPDRADELATMPYHWYLQTLEWRWRRNAILRRDRKRCVRCHTRYSELHVHHRTYERRGHERLDDLMTLCERCHAKEHGIGAD